VGEKGETPDLSGSDLAIAIVVARYNEDVTRRLLRGALNALTEVGVEEPDVFWVPGALELPVAALALAEKGGYDAIVCLGCVIRGDTYHFEIVANESAAGVSSVQLETGIPIGNGILTCDTDEQARARMDAKGYEATLAALELANLLDAVEER